MFKVPCSKGLREGRARACASVLIILTCVMVVAMVMVQASAKPVVAIKSRQLGRSILPGLVLVHKRTTDPATRDPAAAINPRRTAEDPIVPVYRSCCSRPSL